MTNPCSGTTCRATTSRRPRWRRRSASIPSIARLLCLRGLADPDEASSASCTPLDHLHDPFKLADMDRAVERLEAGDRQRERIAIHGDYDVDGITSTVILRRALEMLGGDVVHFIPERLRDGYGLQPAAIDRLHGEGCRSSCRWTAGSAAARRRARARELGLDLIVTDHHEPEGTLPAALAVINPKRRDCTYPDKNLAGVGVALKLVQALCARAGKDKLAAGVRQDRGDRHARRRRPARRREPRDRAARPRLAQQRVRTPSACARCSTPRA